MRQMSEYELVEAYYKSLEALAAKAKLIKNVDNLLYRIKLHREFAEEYGQWYLRFGKFNLWINPVAKEYRLKHYGNKYNQPKIKICIYKYMTNKEYAEYYKKYFE